MLFIFNILQVRRSLRTLREEDDVHGLLGVLEVCMRANFGGTESTRLYSEVRLVLILEVPIFDSRSVDFHRDEGLN